MVASRRGSATILATLLKSTIAGGLLFLLPLILLVFLLGHAMRLAATTTRPVSDLLSVEVVLGPQGEKVIAALACYCTG